MKNYKLPLIILGTFLLAFGLLLFNTLRFWGITALIVGFIALARAFTLKSVEKETKEKPKEKVVDVELEGEPEEETEEEPKSEGETEKIEEEEIEEERETKQ